jgi:hypothetical protein
LLFRLDFSFKSLELNKSLAVMPHSAPKTRNKLMKRLPSTLIKFRISSLPDAVIMALSFGRHTLLCDISTFEGEALK